MLHKIFIERIAFTQICRFIALLSVFYVKN